MQPDYGVFISAPGVSINSATNGQKILNTDYAMLKIDTQNNAGFQTTTLLITTDPPEPAVGGSNYTVLGKFTHGYTYPPLLDALLIVVTPPPTDNYHQAYAISPTYTVGSVQGLIISQMDPGDFDAIYVVADATYVYFIINRWLQIGTTNLLTGTTLQITTHVYVEDVPTA